MIPIWQSQLGIGRYNACGPAACAMILNGYGKNVTAHDLSVKYDPNQSYTSAVLLTQILKDYGLTISTDAERAAPYIALVEYDALPSRNPAFASYHDPHWVVVAKREGDSVTYLDPLWATATDGTITTTEAIFAKAEATRYGIVRVKGTMQETTPIITPTSGIVDSGAIYLRMRNGPNMPTVVGFLKSGAKVAILEQKNDALGRAWYHVSVDMTSPLVFTDETVTASLVVPFTGWCASWYIKTEAPPSPAIHSITADKTSVVRGTVVTITMNFEHVGGAWLVYNGKEVALEGPKATAQDAPQTTTVYELKVKIGDAFVSDPVRVVVTEPPTPTIYVPLLGVNVINDIGSMLDAESKGCRAFLVLDKIDEARALKQRHPEAVVMYRWYSDWKLNGKDQAGRVVGGNDGVIYEIYNEADNWPYGSVKQISDRINYELDAADILLGRGSIVALGCYSVGCPEFNDQAICDQVKRYAPLYNSNPKAVFSMHLYSPWLDHVMDQWYERRWEFLFTKCGFDPKLLKIYSSETGSDRGSVGGFDAQQYTDQQFEQWCTNWQAIQMKPLVVNGVSYPSPFVAAAIFQYGSRRNQKWLGYDVTRYIPILQKFWRK